jgi:hypothetical protein
MSQSDTAAHFCATLTAAAALAFVTGTIPGYLSLFGAFIHCTH